MTVEKINQFKQFAGDRIIKITTDNQHIFYDNIDGGVPIIWDDQSQTFTVYRTTNDAYLPNNHHPIDITTVEYDEIQYMTTFKSCKDAIADFDKLKSESKITAEQHALAIRNLVVFSSTNTPSR